MTYYLGLTGGIASGKSTIDQLFIENNIPVIDADQVAHHLMEPGEVNWQAIVDHFGPEYLTDEQTIDRKKLGELVFNDPKKLKELNQIGHLAIRAEIKRQMELYADQRLVVVDIPLLFEGHFEQQLDGVLVVDVDETTQLTRLMKRNALTSEQAKAKINAQMSLAKKRSLADFVIDNTGTIEETKQQFKDLLTNILVKLAGE